MELNKTYITNKGRALMAKIGAGTTTNFTKMAVSSQQYADSTASSVFEALTSIPNTRQQVSISDVKIRDSVYIDIKAAVSNKDLKTGYKIGCLGFYAMDPNDGEILYAVSPVKEGTGDWFPSDNGKNASSLEVALTVQVGNSANVTMNVDSGAYATVSMLNEVLDDIEVLKETVGITDKGVYGVEVDFPNRTFKRIGSAENMTPGTMFDNIRPWARKKCIVADDGAVLAYRGQTGYSENGKSSAAVTVNGTEYPSGTIAQVMVEQPKFYYKVVPITLEPIQDGVGYHMRKFKVYISPTPRPGFKVHPAFVRDGVVKEYIYLSAYNGSIYDTSAATYLLEDEQVADFADDMLSSIANAKPASGLTQNLTRTNSRLLAQKRGDGWYLRDGLTAYMSLMLFLVEYNSFDTQTLIGRGVVDITDDGASNMSLKTGYTASLMDASGMAEGTNGKVSVTYRGEENTWGNIWNWLEGINIYRDSAAGVHQLYYADHGFTDNTGEGTYKLFNATVSRKDGYPSAICYEANGDMDALFVASETAGSTNWGLCDYFYQHNSYKDWLAARLGGCWYDSSIAGAGGLSLNGAATYRFRRIGARVLYVPAGNGEHKPQT